MHSLQPCDPVAKLNFCNWYFQSVHNSELDPELIFLSNEGWSNMDGHLYTQCSTENKNEIPLHVVRVDT